MSEDGKSVDDEKSSANAGVSLDFQNNESMIVNFS